MIRTAIIHVRGIALNTLFLAENEDGIEQDYDIPCK